MWCGNLMLPAYTLRLDSEKEEPVAYNGKLRNQQEFVIFTEAEGVHAFNFNGDIIIFC